MATLQVTDYAEQWVKLLREEDSERYADLCSDLVDEFTALASLANLGGDEAAIEPFVPSLLRIMGTLGDYKTLIDSLLKDE